MLVHEHVRKIPLVAAFVVALTACAASADPDEDRGEASSSLSSGSCAATLAEGAVNEQQKALHDAIAFAEGTQGKGENDGYDIGFAYETFTSCAKHPNVKTCGGGYCSTASGRYQFLKKTWDATAKAIGATSFDPAAQEQGAEHLVRKVRKVKVPEGRAMTASEFSGALKKLSYEWASLPPGRYGQPSKTAAEMRASYCEAAGC